MLYLTCATVSATTGGFLRGLLRERGIRMTRDVGIADCGVSYGRHIEAANIPWLNANARAGDKLDDFNTLHGAYIKIPHVTGIHTLTGPGISRYPMLGRKRNHFGGTDITIALQQEDAERLLRTGQADFMVEYIPRAIEYRVWIYRDKHLGTYEKILAHPEKMYKVGCNHDNGWAFQAVPYARLPRKAITIAVQAVEALQLDFGAVDIIFGKDSIYYVLEVNSAPGVETNRRSVLVRLAEKIVRWIRLGHPERPTRNIE